MLADEGVLNLSGALWFDATLARDEPMVPDAVMTMVGGMAGSGSTVRPRGERGCRGQERSKNNDDLRGSEENHAKVPQFRNSSAIY